MKPLVCYTLLGLSLIGCESKAGTGALVGGGLGAATGVLISPTPAGALIGTAVGAGAGALVGASLEDHDKQNIQQRAPETGQKIDNKEQLSLDDIKKMSEVGISDDKIIGTIQSTGSVYHLTHSEIEELKQAGVSKRVIDYMLQTGDQ